MSNKALFTKEDLLEIIKIKTFKEFRSSINYKDKNVIKLIDFMLWNIKYDIRDIDRKVEKSKDKNKRKNLICKKKTFNSFYNNIKALKYYTEL